MNTGRIITALAAILAIPAMAADAPGYFQVPGTETTLKVYGKIQLREAYGLNGDGINTDMTARDGKNQDMRQKGQWSGSWRGYLGVTTTTPSDFGDVITKIEGRFKNNDGLDGRGVGFNMERAFVQIGGLKAGTDDSIFGYGAWEPNTLYGCYSDENGDWVTVRQVTYMFSPVKGLDLGISLEGQNADTKTKAVAAAFDPDNPGTPTAAVPGTNTSNGTVPNISAVAAFSQDWGGVTLGLNYQQMKDWVKTGHKASGSGTSFFLSGGWNITSADHLTAMILDAGANYGSYNDGFYAYNNDYEFYKSLAYNASYTHDWNDKFSSALTIGQVKWDKETKASVADDYKLTEFILNTTWQVSKTVSFGVEYQHAEMKASNTKPFTTDTAAMSDKNKLDQIRFKLQATLF